MINRLFNNNLLGLHIVAVAEADHIHASTQVEAHAVVVLDTLGAQDAAGNVHYLQGAGASNDELTVADESKAVGDVVGGFLGEDDFEARGIVGIC